MNTLHVVTHRRWIADDFSAALIGTDIQVRHSFGFDLPDFRPGDAVWAPMEWLARARLALDNSAESVLPLIDPGPKFLTRMPDHTLGRSVDVTSFASVAAGAGPEVGFFKPANIKVEGLPAAWCTREEFIDTARSVGLHSHTDIMFTPHRLDIVEEHRCFILGHQVVTSSPYVIGDAIWHPEMTSAHTAAAERFANQALIDLAAHSDTPFAFVLDVALTAGDNWVVLETNPTWSSAQYGADLAVVTECLFAANQVDPMWMWRPGPHLWERAQTQRRLIR